MRTRATFPAPKRQDFDVVVSCTRLRTDTISFLRESGSKRPDKQLAEIRVRNSFSIYMFHLQLFLVLIAVFRAEWPFHSEGAVWVVYPRAKRAES